MVLTNELVLDKTRIFQFSSYLSHEIKVIEQMTIRRHIKSKRNVLIYIIWSTESPTAGKLIIVIIFVGEAHINLLVSHFSFKLR